MKNLYTQTLNQIVADGFKIVENDNGKLRTEKGSQVTIWEAISQNIFKKVEIFRMNVNL